MEGTFDVQSGRAWAGSKENDQICFSCLLATGSKAEGCYVEYRSKQDKILGETVLRGSSGTLSSCESYLYSRVYTVLFYDLEFGGKVNKSQAAFEVPDINAFSQTPIEKDNTSEFNDATKFKFTTISISPTITIDNGGTKSEMSIHDL